MNCRQDCVRRAGTRCRVSDLWPGVERRIRTRRVVRWQHAAAALLLFGAGTLTGVLLERGPDAPVTRAAAAAESPLHAAAAVQRAGSDYVAAVTRMRELGAADEVLRIQGYEAALAVLSVTAQELASALGPDEHQALVGHARDARAAASERLLSLLGGGGE
jgi:hypothetical protein